MVDFRERLPEYGCSRRVGIAASAISDERAVSIEIGLDIDNTGVAGEAAVPGDVVTLVGGVVPLVGVVVPPVCELGWVADEAITVLVGTDGGADGGAEPAFVAGAASNGWARIATMAASKLVTVCTA